MTKKQIRERRHEYYIESLLRQGKELTYKTGKKRKVGIRTRYKKWRDNNDVDMLAQIRRTAYKGHISFYYHEMQIFRQYYQSFKDRQRMIDAAKKMTLKPTSMTITPMPCDYDKVKIRHSTVYYF